MENVEFGNGSNLYGFWEMLGGQLQVFAKIGGRL